MHNHCTSQTPRVPAAPHCDYCCSEKGERKRGRAMKIVNLISIDIESAAASDVANNAAKTRLEFDLFELALPPPVGIVIPFFALRPQSMAMFFAAGRPRTKSLHIGPLTPLSKVCRQSLRV